MYCFEDGVCFCFDRTGELSIKRVSWHVSCDLAIQLENAISYKIHIG